MPLATPNWTDPLGSRNNPLIDNQPSGELASNRPTYATIVAKNYLAHARVLGRSIREHHPHQRLVVLLIDDEAGDHRDDSEPFELMRPSDLGLGRAEFHRMATIYNVLELSTAIKPWLLEHLVATRSRPVVYLDPDIEVFSPLDELEHFVHEHAIVLTPHSTTAMPRDELGPSEIGILKAGVYNLGCIAINSRSAEFLAWWKERLARDCLASPDEGYSVDQKWVDFVPSLFPDHYILRDTAYNVAYWNLFGRAFTERCNQYFVDERPLRFFHFSGFSPKHPNELSSHQTRISLSEHPALAHACRRYRTQLVEQGYWETTDIAYGFGSTKTGVAIDQWVRRLYRTRLIEQERRGEQVTLPDPFDDSEAPRFLEWLSSLPRQARQYLLERYPDNVEPAGFPEKGVHPPTMNLPRRAKAALRKPVAPLLRVLDRRFAIVHHHIDERASQLAQDVNTDVESMVELVLTFERFAIDFTERIDHITETLEALLAKLSTIVDDDSAARGT